MATILASVKGYIKGMNAARAAETPEQKRSRILAQGNTYASEYDLAVALGYQPESWDGMWKLVAEPFRFEGGKVIVTEVVYDDEGRSIVCADGMRFLTSITIRDIPTEYRAQTPIYCSLLP